MSSTWQLAYALIDGKLPRSIDSAERAQDLYSVARRNLLFRDINIHLPDNPPRWFWPVIVLIGAAVGALWAYPELRKDLLARIERVAFELPIRTAFPAGCAPMRVETPDAQSGELRVLFTDGAIDDLLRCNPRALRDEGSSDVADIGEYRILTSSGPSAVVNLHDGAATIALPDAKGGGGIIAFRCQPKPANYIAFWGSFVPTKLPLLAKPLIDDVSEACAGLGVQ